MPTTAALGIDLGTSSVKVALLTADGEVLADAARGYDVGSTYPGWAETDPLTWASATAAAVREVVAAAPGVEIAGVGLAGQMHGAVLVDEDGDPTRPAMLWPDTRAFKQTGHWRGLAPSTLMNLANPVTPGMAGPMLSWLVENEPDVVERSSAFLAPKDWLRSRLTGPTRATDPSDASATLLWDLARDDWSGAVVDAAGIPRRLLPEPRPSAATAGRTTSAAAAFGLPTGLPAGLPVAHGCADAAATLVGLAATPGRMVLTVGTGAQAILPGATPSPALSPRHHVYRDAADGWYAMAAVMNAGLALTRVAGLLDAGWDELYRDYDRSGPIPGFLPFFTGERLPRLLPADRAGWFDVGIGADRSQLLAAALEGVAFAVRHALEALPAADDEIDLVGGGSRSSTFAQLLADTLGRPLRRLTRPNATVAGAALLGWRAAGHRVELAGPAVQGVVEPRPGPELEDRYRRFLDAVVRIDDVAG